MPFNCQAGSPLFKIPSEARQLIYSFLIPKGILDIELCNALRPSGNNLYSSRRISPIAALRQQLDALSSIKQTNGIHLLLVCQWMRIEVLELLASVTVRFHCPQCFNTFLPTIARGLGIGVQWMKSVQIIPDLARTNQNYRLNAGISMEEHLTGAAAKAIALDNMLNCQREAWKWYGPLHLTEREKWTLVPDITAEGDTSHDSPDDGESNIDPAPPPPPPPPSPKRWLINGKFYV